MVKAKLSELIPFNKYTISRVYTGAECGCRCGCLGRYFDFGTKGATRGLNKALKANPEVKVFELGPEMDEWYHTMATKLGNLDETIAFACSRNGAIEWIDVAFPENKTVTIYTVVSK